MLYCPKDNWAMIGRVTAPKYPTGTNWTKQLKIPAVIATLGKIIKILAFH
jgi:hypothetical protein